MPSDIRDLAKIVFGRSWADGKFLMLAAYFDDSGTHQDSPVVVIGGLIGRVSGWESLDHEWRKRLKSPINGKPALDSFHLTECVSGRGEFSSYNQAERDHVRHCFREIIRGAGLYGLSSTIFCSDWDSIVTGDARAKLGSAESHCFRNSIEHALHWARENHPKENSVALTFDAGRSHRDLGKILHWYKLHYEGSPDIRQIGFADVKTETGLQAADTIANEVYRNAWQWRKRCGSGKTDAHFLSFSEKIGVENLYLDREAISRAAANVDS